MIFMSASRQAAENCGFNRLGLVLLALQLRLRARPNRAQPSLGRRRQVFAIDLFGFGGAAEGQQVRAQCVPHRVNPVGRLGVAERIFAPDRFAQLGDSLVDLPVRGQGSRQPAGARPR